MRSIIRMTLCLWLLLWPLAACNERPASTIPAPTATTAAVATAASIPNGTAAAPDLPAYPLQAASAEGAYFVACRPAPDPVPLNDLFDLRLHVASAEARGEPLDGVAVAVDADMPEHGHGMTTAPRLTRNADGTYQVEGMRFHMSGYWEIYVDVTRDGVTERAILPVTLE